MSRPLPLLHDLPAGPATVLLVEDDDAIAYWVRRILALHGSHEGAAPRVVLAGTLADALAELPGADCVLLDLTLPDSEGLDSFAAIQRAAPRVPVVVLTALHDEDLGTEAVRRGAQDFLSKQSPPEQIARAVRYALLRTRWHRARWTRRRGWRRCWTVSRTRTSRWTRTAGCRTQTGRQKGSSSFAANRSPAFRWRTRFRRWPARAPARRSSAGRRPRSWRSSSPPSAGGWR